MGGGSLGATFFIGGPRPPWPPVEPPLTPILRSLAILSACRIVVCCSEGLRPVETEDEVDGWAGVIHRVGRDVLLGGEWRPPNCEANTHLAVVIPCRDRDRHLRIMLRHLIPILQRQLAHFRIFVVEQVRRRRYSRLQGVPEKVTSRTVLRSHHRIGFEIK